MDGQSSGSFVICALFGIMKKNCGMVRQLQPEENIIDDEYTIGHRMDEAMDGWG